MSTDNNPFLEFDDCPICHHTVPKMIIFNVRGRSACLHCHLDWIWDFIEGTRRMIEQGQGPKPPREQREIPPMTELPRFDFPQ